MAATNALCDPGGGARTMAHPQYKILILDGTPNGHELGPALRRNVVARAIKADSVRALATMARAFDPDLAILAADHPERE